MGRFEEKYFDVLQNIEFAIVRVYRQHSDLVDFDVEQALSGLIREYKASQRGKTFDPSELAPLARDVYDSTREMCEWRLGQENPFAEEDVPFENPKPLSLDEMVACLKRIRKSVRRWSKRGGRQGYLQFIEQYVK
jgi:hypothetical protein